MSASHTHKNLNDVKDSAPGFGHGDVQEARFANDDLETERTGVSLLRVKPGQRQAFAHKHDDAEEVYIVTSGSGRIKLDDEIIEITELDAIRIAPGVVRQLEAGDEGLEWVAVGARHEGDGELLPDWWSD
jgi:mannose-6-phosphate isomerase-like protein (cupin superfamily)